MIINCVPKYIDILISALIQINKCKNWSPVLKAKANVSCFVSVPSMPNIISEYSYRHPYAFILTNTSSELLSPSNTQHTVTHHEVTVPYDWQPVFGDIKHTHTHTHNDKTTAKFCQMNPMDEMQKNLERVNVNTLILRHGNSVCQSNINCSCHYPVLIKWQIYFAYFCGW